MDMVDFKEFKPFRDTYKMITFTMSVGLIYPNPDTDLFRLLAMPSLIISVAPLAFIILIDMFKSVMRWDILNIIRHSTVLGPFLAGFFKMLLMFYKRKEARQILEEIDRDYESYNDMTDDYKELASNSVKNNLIYSERCWVIVVITCVMIFPVMAVAETTYNYTFKSEPVKSMIHDLNLPYGEPELRFESPQFELMFIYMFYCAILYVVNFIGYDGFFGISINHACMKMELYCKALEDALKCDENVQAKVANVIREQCRMFDFVDLIQDTYNIWLGLIFMATMIQLCTSLYIITEGYGFDLRYTIFVIGVVIHIYLPCRYAAKLKAMSVETSTKIYCSGWENVHDTSVQKMIMFMVARAQKAIEITAFDMLVFDMDLFVSILQTSYSMFTLLRS